MDDPREMQRLRLLLGPERFEEECLKGQNLKGIPSNDKPSLCQHEPKSKDQSDRRRLSRESGLGKKHSRSTLISEKKVEMARPDLKSTSRQIGSGARRDSSFARFRSPWSDSEDSDIEEPVLTIGQQAGPGEQFCPVLAVSRYPYKCLNHHREFMETVAGACFNNGKFWDHKWTIFYLPLPDTISSKPLLLVPRSEVVSLFAEIRQKLNAAVDFPNGAFGYGFSIAFGKKDPRPVFLGVSRSRYDFNRMQDNIPFEAFRYGASTANEGDDRQQNVFFKKIEAAVQAAKAGRVRAKAMSKTDRTDAKLKWEKQLYRAQSYLGLRPAPTRQDTEAEKQSNGLSYPDNNTPTHSAGIEQPPKLNVQEAPNFPFWNDTVLIAVDIEANERSSSMITEVGIATLDTRHINDIAPGPSAENWRVCARYRHLRVDEYKSHRNTHFIHGCPDRFEKIFGDSEFIKKADLPKALSLCCKPPFHGRVGGLLGTGTPINAEPVESEKRNIVVVGHNIDSDIQYLKSVGFDLTRMSGLLEVLDTTMMHRAMVRRTEPTSLAGVLQLLGISGWNLHNAGNDAAYTLQACIGIAVDYLANSKYRDFEAESAKRREEAVRLAGERQDDDYQEWLRATVDVNTKGPEQPPRPLED